MIIIHATKKFFAKLSLDSVGCLKQSPIASTNEYVPVENPLDNWHGNLFTLQRRNCVLLMHDATRFPLFIKGLLKADFANFEWHFTDSLMNTLLKLGANASQLDTASALIAPLQFNSQCNRSVLGTMNQMKGDIEHMLWSENAKLENVSSYRTGAWLADRPCTVKGQKECIWPERAMLELLSQPIQRPSVSASQDTVVDLAEYRERSKR